MSTTVAHSTSASPRGAPLGAPKENSPFLSPLPHTAWSPTAANNALGRDICSMNSTILADLQGLSSIPRVYAALFHRTRTFASTVRQLVAVSPGMWTQAACLLVDWGVHILRHPEIRLERFLNSQRESLYWILDDALLRICLDQWDPPHLAAVPTRHKDPSGASSRASTSTSSSLSSPPSLSRSLSTSAARIAAPWDVATRPVRRSLAEAQHLVPLWGQQDVEETKKWSVPACEGAMAEWFEVGWFRRSTSFLAQSTRVYEIWRTMRRVARGQLPAELANAIVEDVAAFEKLPLGDLREMYFPTAS